MAVCSCNGNKNPSQAVCKISTEKVIFINFVSALMQLRVRNSRGNRHSIPDAGPVPANQACGCFSGYRANKRLIIFADMNYPIFRSLILCVAILSAGQLFSQSDLIVCDKAPGEAIACLKDIGWEQPLEPVLQMSPAGTTDTTWEKSIYFILVSADFWKADSATLQLYYEIDPANNQRKLIDTYQLKVSPEWNYCWKTWTFYEPGTYSVDAYIGDKYVDFGIVMILPKPE